MEIVLPLLRFKVFSIQVFLCRTNVVLSKNYSKVYVCLDSENISEILRLPGGSTATCREHVIMTSQQRNLTVKFFTIASIYLVIILFASSLKNSRRTSRFNAFHFVVHLNQRSTESDLRVCNRPGENTKGSKNFTSKKRVLKTLIEDPREPHGQKMGRKLWVVTGTSSVHDLVLAPEIIKFHCRCSQVGDAKRQAITGISETTENVV